MSSKNINEIFRQLDEYFAQGKLDRVEPFLCGCLEEAKESRDHGIYISVANELIGYYRSVSMYAKAFTVSEDVLMLMEELNLQETEHFATTLLNAATAYRAAGKWQEAYEYYARALQIYENILSPEDYRFAGLYNNMSILMEQLGENEKAAGLLQKAIDIVEKLPDCSMELATSKTNLALIYFKLKDDSGAQKLLEEAISLFEKAENGTDAHYSAALSGMGEAYFRMGRLEKSLEYYEKAAAEVKKHFGENQSYGLLCGNCAAVCARLGEKDKQAYYEEKSRLFC